MANIAIENNPVEIMDFPSYKMVIFHSFPIKNGDFPMKHGGSFQLKKCGCLPATTRRRNRAIALLIAFPGTDKWQQEMGISYEGTPSSHPFWEDFQLIAPIHCM